MEISEKLAALSGKIKNQAHMIQTEEATKAAFVMPFISSILGYDVFDPEEVTPEYICDIGTKKGEKIDYAIKKDGNIQILIECKKIGESLSINHAMQLFRYFHVTSARVAILTNGQCYKFFTDLDTPNKMDEKPFLELDMLDVDEYAIPEIIKLNKKTFDVESIVNAAGELKYVSQIKKVIGLVLNEGDDDFTKYIASKVYDGVVTQKVRDLFSTLIKKGATQYLNDQLNIRLKSAMFNTSGSLDNIATGKESVSDILDDDDIETTEDEINAYLIVKAIASKSVSPSRISIRDSKTYCAILFDNNNRKPICRFRFNTAQKYLSLFDANKKELKHAINELDDIYTHAEAILATIEGYTAS
ncbi:type I restriction enzyme HsdR N-terminal domain-containing protein [Hafnia alvei]|uniref:Type I restriction enzyme HsdR protein n=1 Tax=Hafnia alvei ATCC 51873 TaxID=1002364 RepID=G9Y0M2_HAFAL|nr:type I restriction enzyme HsdR N-terminal domain-containing protein [Hafnia alvei]EHM48685.1 type I restriction enzyme HsdR protein [Hafnia alvei ATCC 51873]QQE46143.1 type I restriction enzyme HsdR N-terminal domain-containing protein [Hafnia alvei]